VRKRIPCRETVGTRTLSGPRRRRTRRRRRRRREEE